MATVDISTIPAKGATAILFKRIEAYIEIMDRQRELGVNKSKIIRLRSDDFSTAMRLGRGMRSDADGVTFKGWPIARMGA